jgi:hypothetical protein
VSVLQAVADRAAADSPLWAGALLPGEAAEPRFAGSCPDRHLLGVEMIYEGYLLHYGRSRLFSQADRDLALLTGDYLYAAGLREICATGDLEAVGALAALISRCARNQGNGSGGDDALWDETVASLSRSDSGPGPASSSPSATASSGRPRG